MPLCSCSTDLDGSMHFLPRHELSCSSPVERQQSHVVRMKAVHILLNTHLLQHSVLLHVLRQRQLHQHAVHLLVDIQLLYGCQQLVGGG